VRSHAKASTAGSTKRRAGSLGRIFRGADAGRGASLEAKGTGAPKSRLLGLPLALLVAVFSLILGVGSASAVAPTIVSAGASSVTTKAALLEAQINPEGEATSYRFEYGTADCSTNPCASTSVGNVGAGSSAVKVTKEVSGLSPGTTYHFRVLATNGSGTVEGADRTFTTFALVPASDCPNQAFRTGPAANLPDCRGYELVSPVEKNGKDIRAEFGDVRTTFNQSAPDGDKLTYSSSGVFGDQLAGHSSSQYIATRGPAGWSTHGINAPRGSTLVDEIYPFVNFAGDLWSQFQMFSPDLSEAWVNDTNKEPLTPDAGQGWANLYRRDNLGDSYEAVTKTTLSPPNNPAEHTLEVVGRSSDSSHVVFGAASRLTPDAAPDPTYYGIWQTYDYSDGKLHLVSVLPDGTANPTNSSPGSIGHEQASSAGQFGGAVSHVISDDGSRIFWTAAFTETDSGIGAIYVRENPGEPQSALNGSSECTEPAKACTRLVVGGSESRFQAASADGSKVLYTTGSEINVLSEFDVDTEVTTPVAGEVGGVVGAGDDLSYFYFVSKEALDAGATAGEWNLYVDHDGAVRFITTLDSVDLFGVIQPGIFNPGGIADAHALYRASRVTPDGRHLAFMSNRSLTGYDNTDALNGKADMEVYLYDAGADELTCASCNPSGARPVGEELLPPYYTRRGPASETTVWAAAWLQTWLHATYHSRALSDDGNRLYFNSFDALVPQDTNGVQDVYQWEAEGSGSCQTVSGCVSLISTGESPDKSEFIDASADGSNVFIETSSGIDPRDPGLIDIYDARVNGGFPGPPSPTECFGDACQSVPEAPRDPTPASAAFEGAGNPTPKKTHRRCRARSRHAGKGDKHRAKHKKAKRCKRTGRRASR
jgi:hypothetical protein